METAGSAAWPAALRCSVAAAFLMMSGVGEPRVTGQSVTTAAAPGVAIGGDVARPFTLTLDQLKAMPRASVTVSEGGRLSSYDGVPISEILKRAGAPLGSELSGKALASYVLVTGADGYEVVYSLAEVDPALTDSQLLVADSANGAPLGEKQGPMRLVAPRDKRAARSVRMLQRIDVVRLRP